MNFTPVETRVLNRVQRDIPLVEKPFEAIGAELGIDEKTVIDIIRSLKERRAVRNIAGIFEPSGLGYATTLAALRVKDGDVESAAGVINGHPGVSHNYLRNHRYNIWFTLAEESGEILASTLRLIADRTSAEDQLTFRNERLYKIGLNLPVGEETVEDGNGSSLLPHPAARHFSEAERQAILFLQQDLPLSGNPFRDLLSYHESPLTVGELLGMGNDLKNAGFMRRYSAVIRPVHSGYKANAMTAWKTESVESADRAAGIFIRERGITHVYRRTVHRGKWEYPLFAMIHAKDEGGLADIVARLSRETGIEDFQILSTVRELKKEKVIYFSPEFDRWHAGAGGD